MSEVQITDAIGYLNSPMGKAETISIMQQIVDEGDRMTLPLNGSRAYLGSCPEVKGKFPALHADDAWIVPGKHDDLTAFIAPTREESTKLAKKFMARTYILEQKLSA